MRLSDFGYALSFAAASILAGCGGSQLPIGAAPQSQAVSPHNNRHPSASYAVLYSFQDQQIEGKKFDGTRPAAGLVDVNGTFYGATYYGGKVPCRVHTPGCGTVFTITPSGSESVLYRFKGGVSDGQAPDAGLIKVDGKLYGTTEVGGANGDGTVFSITPSGQETVLHSFGASGDGVYPIAALLNVNGTLYGTTYVGGTQSVGTVFSIAGSGQETVLHSFGASGDGGWPGASLIKVAGTLYGTTQVGGANGDGTVFSITPSGKETVLYSFKGAPSDGKLPEGPLIDVKGTLYGTTATGGANKAGTVFSITPSGHETVIYSFKGGTADGQKPQEALINVHGTLYGVTGYGGAEKHGTVFSITPSGTESVLHSFGSRGDGVYSDAPLLNVKGTLYGTTYKGGANNFGTVFALSP